MNYGWYSVVHKGSVVALFELYGMAVSYVEQNQLTHYRIHKCNVKIQEVGY